MSLEEYLSLNNQLFSTEGEMVSMRYSDLEPNSSYVAYCYGMEPDGTRTTEMCNQEFSTEIIATSEIEFTLSVEDGICGSYGDEQMAQRLINMEQARFDEDFYGTGVDWSNAEWIFTGEQSVWGRADLDWTFEAGKTYRIYVFGIDQNGARTTAVARFDQQAAEVEPSDMTFEVELVHNAWDHLIPLLKNDTVSHVDQSWGRYSGCVFDTTYSLSWFAEDAEGKFGEWNYIEFTPVRTEGEGYNMSEPFKFWENPHQNGKFVVL